MSSRVAVIPARGGSKRIPRKNIRPFAGRPLISYSIQAALDSGVCDRVLVSTDDEEIAEVARTCGAEVPFVRPADLSDDFTGTGAVVNHALRELEHSGVAIDYVCCIYATAPLIRAERVRAAFEALAQAPEMSHAFSVGRYGYPVMRSLVSEGQGVRMLFPEHMGTRSQDLPPVFHDAGQFYWSRRQALADNVLMFSPHSIPIELPAWEVQDIDTPEDWRRAEILYEILQAERTS
ncbi:pseudaminic acid cytidylyltransferase [Pokkaliibacter sp. CJK22405]|uniref:pseudaminic acid cytidylyltransferase n=1 Tax=Pokkaliibacter sp. CJK22405 TaxID=3384615 RepID=UPI00398521F4